MKTWWVRTAAQGFAAAMLLFGQALRADTIEYITPSSSKTGDGPVDAEAIFTVSGGQLKLTLTNLEKNPMGDAQLISGISFYVSGSSGSGTLASTNSAKVTYISSGGKYTAGVSNTLSDWVATESKSTINLNLFTGGKPDILIIGPDNKGNLDPSLGGLYSNATTSISNHNPSALGSATFTFRVPGLTSAQQISRVVFQFGTTPGPDTVAGAPVPEPGSLVLLGTGLASFAGISWRRRKSKAKTVA